MKCKEIYRKATWKTQIILIFFLYRLIVTICRGRETLIQFILWIFISVFSVILSAPYSDDFISHLLPCISNCIISKGHHPSQHGQGNDNDHSTVNPIQFIVYPDPDHGRNHQQDVDLISFCHQSCMNAMLHSHMFGKDWKCTRHNIMW